MDFTIPYNDGEGIEKTPQAVKDLLAGYNLGYDYTDICVCSVGDNNETVYEVGIKDEGENMNDAPVLKHDYSYMIDAMEKFKRGDDEGAAEGFTRLMRDVPEVTQTVSEIRRNPIARAETNAEMCLFNTRDLDTEAQTHGYRGVALLNPSVGTVKRYTEIYPKNACPIFITETDENYVRRISSLCNSLYLALPVCTTIIKLTARYVYYTGFRSSKMFSYNEERLAHSVKCLTYVGFRPNLLAMSCAGVDIIAYSEMDGRFVYVRKNEEISVNMRNHFSMIYADVLMRDFSKLKYYNRAQGIMHDLVTSLYWNIEIPIIKARPIPVGILVPRYSGPIDRRHNGIFIDGRPIATATGERVQEAWCTPMNLADHRYMTGQYHGAIYDAGKVVRVSTLGDFLRENSDNGKYDDDIIANLLKGKLFGAKDQEYVEDPKGPIRLRENRDGLISRGKKKYNKEIISNYEITIEHAIEYKGDRLEMYGVTVLDLTTEKLELGNVVTGEVDIEFGECV